MSCEIKSRIIDENAIDFIEIDGKPVAQLLLGVDHRDVKEYLKEELWEEPEYFGEFDQSDLDDAEGSARGDIIESVISFMDGEESISKKSYSLIAEHLDKIK